MKKVISLFLYVIVSLYISGCEKDDSTFNNTDNNNYTPVSTEATTTCETVTTIEITYIVNINTGKFHYPDCPSVEQMNENNKWEYSGARDDLVSRGYKPCKKCEP